MLDAKKIRQDFPMFANNPDLIYLDNGATTFKPQVVIDRVNNYYTQETCNVHRGDYDLSFSVDGQYEEARKTVAHFINCKPEEVVFTNGASSSLNQIAYGYAHKFLKKGDVVLTTEAEHASNILPWFRMAEELGLKIEYIPLTDEGKCTVEAFKQVMNEKVKVVSMAQVSNVLGYIQPIKEITKIAHEFGAAVVVDGAQSVPHIPVDVQDLDIDFLAFSGHKMCGPSGVGVMWGKYDLLQQIDPYMLGGGANARFDMCGNILLKDAPYKFEAGTPCIEGVLGLDSAIKYLESIGMENIQEYELMLRDYAVSKLKELDNIILYNADCNTGIVTFNVKDVFAQDAASFLNTKHIAVRSGNHCAKILVEIIKKSETIRMSSYFYNTKEEIDKFVEACKDITVENCVGIFF